MYWFRGACTCTWSSSVTGSEVLVDLSVIRFLLVGRGLALDNSAGEKIRMSTVRKSLQYTLIINKYSLKCKNNNTFKCN